jgi:hypothetical protein
MSRAAPGAGAEHLTSELNVTPETPFSAESRWGVFSHSAFVALLVATSLSPDDAQRLAAPAG